MKWVWINSSKIGTSHLNSEHPKNQDAHFVYLTQNNILISAIADGAGSTTFGGYGAWITCRIIKNFFIKWYSSKTYHPSEDTVRILINDIRYQLLKTAQKRKTEFRNFASTLSVVLASKEETVFFSIGDSPIVAKSNNIWGVTTCPDVGEYASTTFFTTEKNFPRMQFIRSKTIFSAFALMSDGVEKYRLMNVIFPLVANSSSQFLIKQKKVPLSEKINSYQISWGLFWKVKELVQRQKMTRL